jgi:hypothetical protein
MTQRCTICKTGVVAHWIPVDIKDRSKGSYPVCSSSWCKLAAWTIDVPHTKAAKGSLDLSKWTIDVPHTKKLKA